MEALSEEFRQEKIASEVYFTVICPYMVNTGLCKNPKINKKYEYFIAPYCSMVYSLYN